MEFALQCGELCHIGMRRRVGNLDQPLDRPPIRPRSTSVPAGGCGREERPGQIDHKAANVKVLLKLAKRR